MTPGAFVLFGAYAYGDGNNQGLMLYRYSNGCSTPFHGGAGLSVPTSTPTLYIIEVSSGTVSIYIDSVTTPWRTHSYTPTRPNGHFGIFTLQGNGASTYHGKNGSVSLRQLRVYNRVLTSTEKNLFATMDTTAIQA